MNARTWVAALALTLVASVTAAQTTPPTVTIGQPFRIAFDHAGQRTDGYRIYIDDTRVATLPLSALQGGSVQTTISETIVTARGAHVLAVSAYNADAESPRATLAFTAALEAPPAPTNLQIVVQLALNADGTVTLTWSHAAGQ